MVIIKDFSNWFNKKLNTVKKFFLANDIGTVSHKQMKYNRLITEYGMFNYSVSGNSVLSFNICCSKSYKISKDLM